MSRSMKRSPYDHRTPGTRWSKRQASKAARRFTDEMQYGKWYRKLYCSWDICDYRFFKTKQQAIHEWETSTNPRKQRLTRSEVIQEWEKIYKRK